MGSGKEYSETLLNTANTTKWFEVIAILEGISDKRPEIKNIVIDDAGFIMSTEYFQRASEGGCLPSINPLNCWNVLRAR